MSVQASTGDRIGPRTDSASWPWGLWGVISVGVAYGLVYMTMRLSLSHNLPQDDVTANILAQTLEPGYVERQPPLYEWILWSVQRFTGPTLPSFLLIKYGMLTATFAFLYLAAVRILRDHRFATVAGLSPLLLYQTAWNLHEGVTHTMVLMCAVAASFWAFMRLIERGRLGDYLLFGLIAGLGLISKYGYAGLLVILLSAALLQPALRARLLDWRMLAAAGSAAAVTAPLLYWLMVGSHDLVAVYNTAVAPEASSRLTATLIGLGLAIYSPLAFLFPLDLILPILFPRMIGEGWAEIRQTLSPRNWDKAAPDWRLLLLHITLGGFLVLMLGAVLTGATHYLERYMHPFFLLTPLWLLALAEESGYPQRRVLVLAGILFVATVMVVPIRYFDALNAAGPDCHKCRIAIPYDGLAEALKARGFESGTLIATNRHDAGNLRRLFPHARIVSLRRPAYAPPLRAVDRSAKLAVVWLPREGERVPKDAAPELDRVGEPIGQLKPEVVGVLWKPTGSGSAERVWQWMVAVGDPSAAPRH